MNWKKDWNLMVIINWAMGNAIMLYGILLMAFPPPVFGLVSPWAVKYFGAFCGFTGLLSILLAAYFVEPLYGWILVIDTKATKRHKIEILKEKVQP